MVFIRLGGTGKLGTPVTCKSIASSMIPHSTKKRIKHHFSEGDFRLTIKKSSLYSDNLL